MSEIDELLAKLEIEFPNKPGSRMLEEEKYRQIYNQRDQILPAIKINRSMEWLVLDVQLEQNYYTMLVKL